MAVKAFAFLTAKEGLSRAEYVDYYENKLVPLTVRLMTGVLDYRRNHIVTDGSFGEAPEFATITEFWFRDRASFDKTLTLLDDPETSHLLFEAESKVFDMEKTRMFLAEEAGPHLSEDVADTDIGQRQRDYYTCYNQGNAESLADFYAEDVVLTSPNGVVEGREALLATYGQMQRDFIDLMVIERMMVSGPVVLAEVRNTLTAKHDVPDFFGQSVAADEQVRLDLSAVYEWRDGRIVKVTLHFL